METQDSSPGPVVEETLTLGEIGEWAMPLETKASTLIPGFPAQVPVIEGDVTATEVLPVAEGAGEWTYTLVTAHAYADVVEWYSRAYPMANWQIDSVSEAGRTGTPATTLRMFKGDAHSTVTVRDSSAGATVDAIVGLGTSAGETF